MMTEVFQVYFMELFLTGFPQGKAERLAADTKRFSFTLPNDFLWPFEASTSRVHN